MGILEKQAQYQEMYSRMVSDGKYNLLIFMILDTLPLRHHYFCLFTIYY